MRCRTSASSTSTCRPTASACGERSRRRREHHGQRDRALLRRRAAHAARVPPARPARAQGRQRRLRHVVVRGVHGAARRRVGEVVHAVRRPGRRRLGDDDRGARRRPPDAEGLPRAARAAVRLLHAGLRHGRDLAARGASGPQRGGDPPPPRGQPLPLHRLPQHRQGGPGRRERVIPAPFEYAAATSVAEAIELLGGDEDAKILAGGHSLVPAMRLRFAAPEKLVDITRIAELRGVRDNGDHLAIGALTRHADLVKDEQVRADCPVLSETAGLVGDPQVRHRGTIGGSVAHADPTGDLGTVLVALEATLVSRGPEGERATPASEFFKSWYETDLGEQDVLTEIRVPKGATGTYLKYSRRTHDWATCAVAGVRRDGAVSVALTSMGPTPLRARGVEEALAGGASPADAAARAAEGTSPASDGFGRGEDRRHLAGVLTRRALERL